MSALNPGDEVRKEYGGTVRINRLIGEGGQGEVYSVTDNGREYALKWYKKSYLSGIQDVNGFYKNLEKNIERHAPTDAFLWPLGLTEKKNDSFGYIMDIRPNRYVDLANYFQKGKSGHQVYFQTFSSVLNAAIQIINGFKILHEKGYSYQDINSGNFFIDPLTGDVLICDNDNVSPYGTNFGILGRQRWMAPEIVLGEADPDIKTDRFSLAVVLFRLLFINHPLEGRYTTAPLITKEEERRYYGEEPIYIFDKDDDRNRPIPGTDHNFNRLMPVYPKHLLDLFAKAFSKNAMKKRNSRILEITWLDEFLRLKAELGHCPNCDNEMFYPENGIVKCPWCGHPVMPAEYHLKINRYEYPLFKGMKLYRWNVSSKSNDTTSELAYVVPIPGMPEKLGLKNLSDVSWTIQMTGNDEVEKVGTQETLLFSENMIINIFDKSCKIIKKGSRRENE